MAARTRSHTRGASRPSFEQARAALSAQLQSRRAEIEQAVLTRVFSVTNPSGPGDSGPMDPEYLEGLRTAISAAVDFGFAVIERGEERAPSPPPVLLAQARLAARHRVGLDTVLRRYSAGYVLLSDFLVEEAERSGLNGAAALQRLLRAQAVLDGLLAAVSEEYAREARERPNTSEQRRAERIERLLAGEQLDTSELAYDFEGCHLGVVASGPEAWEALRNLAAALDAALLAVRREGGAVWAWLGGRRALDIETLRSRVDSEWPPQSPLALGEPAEGLSGWRFTHRQARAALPVALRSPEPVVRYADVALLAAVLQDELLATSLHRVFLEPLETERDGGEVLRETLRAYFAAERNVSSAAAALDVNRHTVSSRLRVAEERLSRALSECATEVDVALRLARFRALSAARETEKMDS